MSIAYVWHEATALQDHTYAYNIAAEVVDSASRRTRLRDWQEVYQLHNKSVKAHQLVLVTVDGHDTSVFIFQQVDDAGNQLTDR